MEGLCIPDSCSEAELSEVLKDILDVIQAESLINITANAACLPKNLEFDTKALVALTILCVLGAFIILGTVVDVISIQSKSHQYSMIPLPINHTNETGNQDEDVPLLRIPTKRRSSGLGMTKNLLLAFSIYTNGKKILSTEETSGNLSCVHGVRFLSISWVVMGHTFVFMLTSTGNVLSYTKGLFRRLSFEVIQNGTISVDTFFALSGLLVSYVTLKELSKNQGKMNWFKFYFHRFWRLTPPYMLVLMVDVCLFRYFGNGPFWSTSGVEYNECRDTWWKNLLYINNFFTIKEMCMQWSWYLSNDMQFFIISPMFIVLLFKFKVIGVVICCLLTAVSTVITGFISFQNDIPVAMITDLVPSLNYLNMYYIKPYCRIGPYVIGILTGYVLFKTKCEVKINKCLNIFCWILATSMAFTILFGLYDPDNTHPLSTTTIAVYNATSRTAWGLCICWVIFSCVTGNGGFVNTILSWSPFVPLGRLTYCTYLVHVLVLQMYIGYLRTLVVASDVTMVFLFFGLLVASLMVAFVTSLMFESPMMGLEKTLFQLRTKNNS